MDERAQHLALRLQLNQGELDRLIGSERLAEWLALPGIGNSLIDAVLRGAEAGRGLPDPVLVEEVLNDLQATALAAEDRAFWHPDVAEGDVRVIRRHIEGPEILLDGEPLRADRGQKRGNAVGIARLAAGAREDEIRRGRVHAGVPRFLAVDH